MDNIFVITFLALLIMNGFLWVWLLFKSKSEEDIVRIIGEALKKGLGPHNKNEVGCYPLNKIICLYGHVRRKDFIEKVQMLQSRINALCSHLGVEIKLQKAQMEKYYAAVVKKKGKK